MFITTRKDETNCVKVMLGASLHYSTTGKTESKKRRKEKIKEEEPETKQSWFLYNKLRKYDIHTENYYSPRNLPSRLVLSFVIMSSLSQQMHLKYILTLVSSQPKTTYSFRNSVQFHSLSRTLTFFLGEVKLPRDFAKSYT
jgi:hypothetical protein